MSKYMNEDLHAAICEALNVYDRPVTVIQVLAWLDAHPDQVPGRTITESESKGLFAAARSGIDFWPPALESTGITVVPDPEPTNAEKLKAVLDAIGDSTAGYREHLASKLDEHGVTAPGGDDDQ